MQPQYPERPVIDLYSPRGHVLLRVTLHNFGGANERSPNASIEIGAARSDRFRITNVRALHTYVSPFGEEAIMDFHGAILPGADLSDADLEQVDAAFADLSGACLVRARLVGANLDSASLSVAVMQGADLTSACLAGADLFGVNLRNAVLRGATLSGADLRDADLRGADLSGALYDEHTRWPDRLDPQKRGAVLISSAVVESREQQGSDQARLRRPHT